MERNMVWHVGRSSSQQIMIRCTGRRITSYCYRRLSTRVGVASAGGSPGTATAFSSLTDHDQEIDTQWQQWQQQQQQQRQQQPQGSLQHQLGPAEQQQQQPEHHHHQQQQQHPSRAGRQALSWQELHRAAQISKWSGLCYLLPEQLQECIAQQHLQLTLVAHGRNEYTSWFVADGCVPHAHFCSVVTNRGPATTNRVSNGTGNNGHSKALSSSSSSSNGNAHNGNGSANHLQPAAAAPQLTSSNGHGNGGSSSHNGNGSSNGGSTGAVGSSNHLCAVPSGVRERFVFLRGVQWSAHDINSRRLSQALMRFWPSPFPRQLPSSYSRSGGSGDGSGNGSTASSSSISSSAAVSPLVAHEGVGELAAGLFDQLRPFLDQADDVGMPLCFAGHSLGGSLAKLNMVLYQLHRRHRAAERHPSCYTFGSPPVLAHQQGGGGHRVLQELGLPLEAVKDFVLENDPIPRALLSVDPTFELLKGWSPVQGLLHLREALAGQGSPLSSNRFLFESVGQVHLIKWTQEGGSEVVPLDAHEIETELSMVVPKPGSSQQPAMPSNVASDSSSSSSSSSSPVPGGFAAVLSQILSPARSLQAWLDHHHGSYAQELEAAALTGIKQQMKEQDKQQQQQGH